ncbi:3-oxoadipate enol-lactonase [Stappia sp.]|uniref:3-oxoadipate enol-lactonase n=1 Tax=Stappia sp. TaxID=1870903 RepID=UPI003A99BF1D
MLHASHRPGTGAVTLAFSNSLGTDLRVWDAVAERLPAAFGLLRYDTAGHGLSSGGASARSPSVSDHADDLAHLLDTFGIGRAVVVGLSVGGLIAQDLAIRHPDRVAGLVLSNTGMKIGAPEMWEARIAAIAAGGMEAIAEATMERWFSERFRRDQPAELALWRTMLAHCPADGYCALARAIAAADLRELTPTIRRPALCIAGSQDLATPPETVRALARAIEGAEFAEIAGAGHLPCVEAPEDIAGLLVGFVEERIA